MSSFFHKLKKAVVHHKEDPTASLCPEYDTLKLEFDSVHDAFLRLQQQILAYKDGVGRTWLSAASLSTDFSEMLSEASIGNIPHPYNDMATTLRASHQSLPTDRERLDTMIDACLVPLREQFKSFEEMKARMINHDRVRDEVVYYSGKTNEMKKTRESSSKPMSTSEQEKYDRNVKKLLDVQGEFAAVDRALVADLRLMMTHRVAVLGPIMLAFVCAEKQMVASYQSVINGVRLVDQNDANAFLQRYNVEAQSKRTQQQNTFDPINNPMPAAVAATPVRLSANATAQYEQAPTMYAQHAPASSAAAEPNPFASQAESTASEHNPFEESNPGVVNGMHRSEPPQYQSTHAPITSAAAPVAIGVHPSTVHSAVDLNQDPFAPMNEGPSGAVSPTGQAELDAPRQPHV